MNGELVYRYFAGGSWSGWINLGGQLTSAPVAVSPSTGRIDVFVRGMSGELVQRTYRNGTWGGWINLGGTIASAPAAVAVGPSRFEVFARSTDFRLVQRSFDGVRWSDWRSLGGDLTAAPAVAAISNSLHVLVRGMNGELVHRSWDGTAWSGWKNLGGELTSAPVVAAVGEGLEVFVRGAGDDLVQRSYDGSTWSGWKNLGGDLRGHLRAKLRLLTHNVYGLQGSWCEIRAKEFGRIVANAAPAFDIVGVQEYYNTPDADWSTCDAGPLSKSIWSTGRYRNSDNYYRFYPEVDWKPDGGVGIFTLHPIKKFDDWRWSNDSQGGLKAAEGFIFARIEIPHTGVTVDTYVVHLNSGGDNRARRRGQLEQLAAKIAENSRTSGNPVVVMGDFNIGGPPSFQGNPGYDDIVSILRNPQDLWLSSRPREDGFTYDCSLNNVAAASDCDYRNRIDYIFAVTDPALTNSPYLITVAKQSSVNVARWKVDPDKLSAADKALVDRFGGFRNGPPNVSDHFGLEATIEIRDR
jgi:endonuclease/exonuclease/phosphatase family metal-dependent hydrolase